MSFDGQRAPDRQTAHLGLQELHHISPHRRYGLVAGCNYKHVGKVQFEPVVVYPVFPTGNNNTVLPRQQDMGDSKRQMTYRRFVLWQDKVVFSVL